MSVKIEISLELIAREDNPGEWDMVTCEPMGGMKYNYYFACFSKIGVISCLDIQILYTPIGDHICRTSGEHLLADLF